MKLNSHASPTEALARVQVIFNEYVPTARCELQDYEHRIGCGDMDGWGGIQDVTFLWRDLDEETVKHHAAVLATKLRAYRRTNEKLGDPEADALLAEIKRRELDL